MPDKQPLQNDSSTGGLKHVPKDGGFAKADAGEMSPYDIIEADIRKFDLDMDPKKTYAAILEMIKQPNYRVMRAHNTLLVLDNEGNGIGKGLIFTADGPQTFVKSLKQLDKALRTSHFKKMSFPSSGMAIEPLLKRAKLNYTAKPTEYGLYITVTA
jgi:hypothetical protein